MIITSPPYWGQRDYNAVGQLGQEPTFHEYIEKLSDYFAYSYNVLTWDGSLWINLGDTYYSSSKGTGGPSKKQESNKGSRFAVRKFTAKELPEKSLCQIPNRFSIELQDDGWILRNTIIWHKPNQMVTSAKDRFTQDYEYVFWFIKTNKGYYFEQQIEPYQSKPNHNKRDKANEKYKGTGLYSEGGRDYYSKGGRNMRTVWSINTESEKGSNHFAKFPRKLPEVPIKATCPVGGVVLDPFFGAGTTAIVAEKLNRKWIGIELSEEYCDDAIQRILKNRGKNR
jgi:DNA modification methylase